MKISSLLTRHNASALSAWLTLALLIFPVATQGQQAPTSLGNRMSVKGNNSAPQLRQGTKTPTVKKAAPGVPQQESCLLASSHRSGSADVVEVSLEASGEVVQTTSTGKEERSLMEVVAGFKYEERYASYSTNGAIRSIRRYEQAGMKRKLGANVVRPLLDSSRKFIISEFDGKSTRVFSAGGPMKDE